MSARPDDLSRRVERLERQLRRWQLCALVCMGLGAGVASCRGAARPAAAPPAAIVATSVVVTAPSGAKTVIEGGHLRLEDPAGNTIDALAGNEASTIVLAATKGPTVVPEITLRVGTTGTPASMLMADRKARNFTNLYINGTAGLEMAGVKEYKNLATP